MKRLILTAILSGISMVGLKAADQSTPDETAFLGGTYVITDYTAADNGKKNTGVRLTSMGMYRIDGNAVASVWRIRNSRDFSQTVTIRSHKGSFTDQITVPADSHLILASANINNTHILEMSGIGTLDTKAANTGSTYSLPATSPADPPNEDPVDTQDPPEEDPVDDQTPPADDGDQDAPTDPEEPVVDTRLERGMEAWRKPDEIFAGAACANCHSPDGFDLAYFDFSREDIIRRTAPHLPDTQDQEAIADLIDYLREEYEITEPKDPRTFRPFQPGSGEVLPGANRYERDEAFGQQFRDEGYRFANTPVLSLAEAKTQRDEWLAIDVRTIDFGIAFPLWSRDRFHGAEHTSHNEWLPSLPRLPIAERVDEWYALQDAYLENPTEENFYAYYDKIDDNYFRYWSQNKNDVDRDTLTEQTVPGVSKHGANLRFKAVQIASHLFRQEHIAGGKDRNERPITGLYRTFDHHDIRLKGNINNPMFAIGEHYRVHKNRAFDFPETAPFPPGLNDTTHTPQLHAEELKVTWFSLGWTFDPALVKTCCGNSPKTGEYYLDALARAGEIGPLEATHDKISYPMHAVFVFTKTFVGKNYDPYAVICTRRCPEDVMFNSYVNNFLSYNKHVRNTPKSSAVHRDLFISTTLNSLRMMLYLAEDALDSGKPIHRKFGSRLSGIKQFIDHAAKTNEDPYLEHDLELYNRVKAKFGV